LNEVFRNVLDSNEIKQTNITIDLPGHGVNLEGFDPEEDFKIDAICKRLLEFINQIDDDVLLVENSMMANHLLLNRSEL
jgi:hypothetical protein|tara:strand:- start:301 stop:537 length:237 start_codon:yes stop_codon:yes gene_type:complete